MVANGGFKLWSMNPEGYGCHDAGSTVGSEKEQSK
jgi:hypothetical protein